MKMCANGPLQRPPSPGLSVWNAAVLPMCMTAAVVSLGLPQPRPWPDAPRYYFAPWEQEAYRRSFRKASPDDVGYVVQNGKRQKPGELGITRLRRGLTHDGRKIR